jgi:receptor protein-tyrosine kinase
MNALNGNTRLNLQAVESVVSNVFPGGSSPFCEGHVGAAEKFRLLAYRLHRAKAVKPISIVLVTSAIPAEGKSTIALNLATVLASKDARTLLMDADLRMPSINKIFGFRSLPGLGGVLSGEVSLACALRRIDPLGLYFLSAGDGMDNPLPLLEGPIFTNVMKQAREDFEWVIVDSPPLNPLVDSQCIAALADAILLVVRWGYTPKEELKNAITTLDGMPLLGMVINMFDDHQDSRYQSHYSRPGMRPALTSGQATVEQTGD